MFSHFVKILNKKSTCHFDRCFDRHLFFNGLLDFADLKNKLNNFMN